MFKKRTYIKKVELFLVLFFLLLFPASIVSAQFQSFDFSGNNVESYQCFDNDGNTYLNGETGPRGGRVSIYKDQSSGYFLCRDFDYDGIVGNDRAVLRPPALQQIEIWFVRILYVIWALIGSFSFLLLVGVGYQYIIRGGTSDTELVALRKRVINYIAGFVLVFLAVPILSTVFRLVGIDNSVACYDVQMPGFQFFFDNVCTGNEILLTSNCNDATEAALPSGLACSPPGLRLYCATRRIRGNTRVGLAPDSPGARNGRSFLCSTESGTGLSGYTTRGTWIQL